jgi:hypothetical protein
MSIHVDLDLKRKLGVQPDVNQTEVPVVLQCEICGGAMKMIAAVHPPETTQKILVCLGLPIRPPPLASAVSDISFQNDSF